MGIAKDQRKDMRTEYGARISGKITSERLNFKRDKKNVGILKGAVLTIWRSP